MRRLALSLALVTALVNAGCAGDTEVILDVDRPSISAGGIDFATITAKAILSGDPVGAGVEVSFETTGGSFDATSSMVSTTASTDGGGKATVKLYSGPSEGSATVTATFYDETSGQSATSSVTVQFTAATGDKSPVDGTFRLTCDAINIGALREPVPDIEVTCDLSALTRTGETIPASALNPTFLTEAGSLTPEVDVYTGEQVFIYSPKGGAAAPRDLTPDSSLNEPSRTDNNGKVRNPRDGLATLVAVVNGEEAFTDTNGNGTYDQGEPFVDAAEPFVDEDDDDEWDPDEKYLDTDNNGRWDRANGKWDAQVKIMAIYKILWTGKLDNSTSTSRIDRLSSTIADGGKLELKAYVLDANMNPIRLPRQPGLPGVDPELERRRLEQRRHHRGAGQLARPLLRQGGEDRAEALEDPRQLLHAQGLHLHRGGRLPRRHRRADDLLRLRDGLQHAGTRRRRLLHDPAHRGDHRQGGRHLRLRVGGGRVRAKRRIPTAPASASA